MFDLELEWYAHVWFRVVDKGFQQKYTYFQTYCESVTHYYGAFPTMMMFSAKNVNVEWLIMTCVL